VRRGLHNRERILDAIYELVRSGVVEPTAEQIARAADVGERSVFRHFEDLERLHADMGARVEQEVMQLALPMPADSGPLETRVHELVRHRSKIYEYIAPFRRAGYRDLHRSAFIRERHEDMTARMRADLERVFAPELAKAEKEVAEAADAIASFEAWERLRTAQKLGRQRAMRVVETGLLKLLAAAG
jgi:AcrR family transcriptional regulator